MVEVLDASNFDEKTKQGIVIVDFFADWCGPCKQMAPVLEELDKEHDDWTVYKVNVEQANELAVKHGVRGIPSFLVFKDGEQKGDLFSGAMPKPDFEAKVKSLL